MSTTATIREVNLTPVNRYGNGDPIYAGFSTSFPSRGIRKLKTVWLTREEAFADAQTHLRAYEERDRMGNMGEVIGVTPVLEKRATGTHLLGFAGVINTYHSNT